MKIPHAPILLITGGGGFSWEGKIIAEELLKRKCDLILAYPETSYESRDFFIKNDAYLTRSITHRHGYNFINILLGLLSNFALAMKIINKHKCRKIIAVGDSSSIPFMLAGKILNKHVTFIETITRTRTATRTCKLTARLRLADEILVQWPTLENSHKAFSYKGNIL